MCGGPNSPPGSEQEALACQETEMWAPQPEGIAWIREYRQLSINQTNYNTQVHLRASANFQVFSDVAPGAPSSPLLNSTAVA